MAITQVSAEMMVSDHDTAVAWYSKLLGRDPDRRPMDGLAEWQITDAASIQVFADPSKAGSSIVTIGVDDLDEHAQRLADVGLELDRQTTPRGQHLDSITDPDGNQIVLAQDWRRHETGHHPEHHSRRSRRAERTNRRLVRHSEWR